MELNENQPSTSLRKVNMKLYSEDPNRYELRSGQEKEAPTCPFGNHYKWIGYDLEAKEYVRFTKSVFKKLINQNASSSFSTSENTD